MQKMKKNLVLASSLLMMPFCVFANPEWGAADTVACYNVGPGIEYMKIIYPDMPLIMWYTTIDLTNEYNKVENVVSRHQVPDVNRWDVMTHYRENSYDGHNVRVAWNHDFFVYEEGLCIGPNVTNGQMTHHRSRRAVLAITKDKKAEVFSSFAEGGNNQSCFDTKIITENAEVAIDSYNSGATQFDGDCIFFNNLNSQTLTLDGRYIKVKALSDWIVNGDNIPCEVLEIADSPLQTSEAECVIYLRNGKRNVLDGLAVGDRLEIQQKLLTPEWGIAPKDVLNAFHGYPSIAHNGVLHEGEYNNFEGGREYEKSSHVMAGISKDKTKLYVCINEMSAQSASIDCVEMAEWMLERGAWDIVNFDSGGSSAIVVNEEMLNLPGRGSVRPVQDAMLAISLAPADNAVDHFTFSKPRFSCSTISSTPLKVISYNKYGDIVEEGVEGCTFSVVPENMGRIDEDGVFYSSSEAGSGKIIAEKDGKSCEITFTSYQATSVTLPFSELLIDSTRKFVIPLQGTVNGLLKDLDPSAFEWVADDPTVVAIEDGIVSGLKNGETNVTGTFEDLQFSFKVKVEIGRGNVPCYDFSKLPESAKVNGVTGLTLRNELPDGWQDGTYFNVEKISGRLRQISLEMPMNLYGIPDGLSLPIWNNDGAISRLTLSYYDNDETRYLADIDIDASDKVYDIDFVDSDGNPLDLLKYPMRLLTLNLYLNSGDDMNFALGDLLVRYPLDGEGGVGSIYDDEELEIVVGAETLTLKYDSAIAASARISIYSVGGVNIMNWTMPLVKGNNVHTVNTKFLTSGVYILMFESEGRIYVKKFIVR